MLAVADRAFTCTGVEIDEAYADVAAKLFSVDGVEIVEGDFFQFAKDSSRIGAFDVLVANPPYVRHHHIPFDCKVGLQAHVLRSLGMQVNGLSGLYVYFVLLADALLRTGAVASWLIPSEFLYTNYGKTLREYLSTKVTLLGIHLFASEDVQFDDALVSSCIVTYRKAAPSPGDTFQFTSGCYEIPSSRVTLKIETLDPLAKWTFRMTGTCADGAGLTLADLFHVTRGIATGNNGYFILDEEKMEHLGLERETVIPLLPGPRHLKTAVIEADERGEPCVDKPRFLLSINAPREEVSRRFPSANRYLEEGERSGVADGGLCRMRKRWYAQEKREPPLYLASYMGRAGGDGKQAIRFFLNRSKGIATNGFICLYPKPFLRGLLAKSDTRETELLALLNAIPVDCMDAAGRHYGGGLKKIEPRELSGVRLPDVPVWLKPPEKQDDLLGLITKD
jgi:hypothetical protein